jgi:outer membrane immunogenic protein
MKTIMLGAFISLGSIAPSLAADLPARPYSAPASSYIPIEYDWTGLYIGANGGYGRAEDCLGFLDPAGNFFDDGCHGAGGGVAGGQLGYRWQFGGVPIVWGVEAQGDWAGLRGSHQSFLDPTMTYRTQLQGFGLFTGQFGYAFNNFLIYAKGGAAVTSDRYETIGTLGGAVLGSVSETRWAGIGGVGVEYAFTPNWTAAFEYDRIFIGRTNITFVDPTGIPFANRQITRDVDLFTVRINYKFGGPIFAGF